MKEIEDKDNSLFIYLKEINKRPLLKREEEREIAKKVAEGDKEALKKLIESNLRFVVYIAKKYQGRLPRLPLEDLISEGNIGLIEAAKRFDFTRNIRFSSYSVHWIRRSIELALKNKSQIEFPYNTEIIFRDNRDLREREFDDYKYAEKDVIYSMLSKEINKTLKKLPEREAEIIKSRYGLEGRIPKVLKKIGEEHNLTKERVRQIERKAVKRLKAKILESHLKKFYLKNEPTRC